MTARFIVGDTRAVTASLPDGSVDFLMTSPPFLALRSYLPADHPDKANEIGSEATPADIGTTSRHGPSTTRTALNERAMKNAAARDAGTGENGESA